MSPNEDLKPSDADRHNAEQEIRTKQHEVKYDLKDFPIDYLVERFQNDEFYIPSYQREYIWHDEHKCRFVESIILGLPIPMMFFANMEDGRLEIVDGAQRIQTLEEFINGDFRLGGLTHLRSLNGFAFSDLPESQRRKFKTRALRIVVLEDSTTAELRQEIFNRVNTSGVAARPSEVRRGAFTGPFMDFVKELGSNERFKRLCPISERMRKRREDEELVLRFLAYSDRYRNFTHDVDVFLDEFAQEHRERFDREKMKLEFDRTMEFVEKYFPNGFAKNQKSKATPRVRFEAIAVGANLALRERPKLIPEDVGSWIGSEEFLKNTTTHASNSGPRLAARVEYVRDSLLASRA